MFKSVLVDSGLIHSPHAKYSLLPLNLYNKVQRFRQASNLRFLGYESYLLTIWPKGYNIGILLFTFPDLMQFTFVAFNTKVECSRAKSTDPTIKS